MLRFIGITGGVGAGKSEILRYIREHYQCEIYLADEVAHLVKEPGQECYEELVALLGTEVLEKDGRINKAAMAERIFADSRILAKVNEIVHPAVKRFLIEKYEQAKKNPQVELFFVEAALLIEAGYKEMADELWYIFARKEIRERRLRESRGYSEDKIRSIMEKQLSEEEYRRECDFVIDNSGSLQESYRQIDERLDSYTRLS